MRFVRSVVVVAAAILGAGCSGGGSPAAPVQHLAPSAAPVAAQGTRATATLHFTIPAKAATGAHARVRAGSRSRDYISPGTLGAIVTATSTDNSANDVVLGLGVGTDISCTPIDGGSSCAVLFPLYADTYTLHVALYDTSEDGHANVPVGNLLSSDTESETIVLGALNEITNILLHPQVASVSLGGTIGTVGGVATKPVVTVTALDSAGYGVDSYANPASYANGPFSVSVADLGDTTGCAGACIGASNDVGAAPTTISQAADASLSLSYSGGGGPGTAVAAYVPNQIVLTGTRPYAGALTVSGGGITPVTTQLLPLFAYPRSLDITASTAFVWAAQYAVPPGAAAGGSYAAYFSTPGSSTCSTPSGQVIAGVGTLTYFPGYGAVFPIHAGVPGTCTLTLSDGGVPADTVTVPITVGPPASTISVPCALGVGRPTGSLRPVRRAEISAPAGAPQLVQSVTGFNQVALPNSVTAGDTLVFIVGDNPGTPSVDPSFDPVAAATDDYGFVYTSTVTQTKPTGAISAGDGCNASMWLGEFSGTSEAAIMAANAASGATTTAATKSIVPNAAGGLVIASFIGNTDATIGPASPGYTAYGFLGPQTMIEVQVANAPTVDTTDPVATTFAGVTDQTGYAEIFQIPPATFTAPVASARSRAIFPPKVPRTRP
jgi:hypothetical protein